MIKDILESINVDLSSKFVLRSLKSFILDLSATTPFIWDIQIHNDNLVLEISIDSTIVGESNPGDILIENIKNSDNNQEGTKAFENFISELIKFTGSKQAKALYIPSTYKIIKSDNSFIFRKTVAL